MMTTLWIIDRHGLLYITVYRENSISEQIALTTLCCNTFSDSAPAAARGTLRIGSSAFFWKVWTRLVVTFPEREERENKDLMMLLCREVRVAVFHQAPRHFHFNKHFAMFYPLFSPFVPTHYFFKARGSSHLN